MRKKKRSKKIKSDDIFKSTLRVFELLNKSAEIMSETSKSLKSTAKLLKDNTKSRLSNVSQNIKNTSRILDEIKEEQLDKLKSFEGPIIDASDLELMEND